MTSFRPHLFELILVLMIFTALGAGCRSATPSAPLAPSPAPTAAPVVSTPAASNVVSPAPSTKAPSSKADNVPSPQAGTPAPLDLCTLMPAPEAEAALGAPVQLQAGSVYAACAYTAGASGKTLSITAAQGNQARAVLMLSAQLFLVFSQAPDARKQYTDLQAISNTLSIKDLVGKVSSLSQAVGYSISPLSDIGDGYWLTYPKAKVGVVLLSMGESYLGVTLTGVNDAESKALGLQLATRALGRLPARFTIEVPASVQVRTTIAVPTIRVEFSSGTVVAPSRVAPSPTLVVAKSTVVAPTPTLVPGAPILRTAVPTAVIGKAPPPKLATATLPPMPVSYYEQSPYAGDCATRPENSLCLKFDDQYVWLVTDFDDSIVSWTHLTENGHAVHVAQGQRSDYYHQLNTRLVKKVTK
jgi:hypothetical protein